MFNSRKNSLIILFISSILLLSACKGPQTPIEKMYDILENAVSAEKVFEEQQTPLVKLEKKEKDIYDQILSAGMKNAKEVTNLATQANDIADQRKELLEKEKNGINKSQKEFEKLGPIIEEIDDPSLKEKAQNLYRLMNERYNIYDQIYTNYSAALKLDQELYAMFKQENLQVQKLEEQIVKTNKAYDKILKANDKFNEKTKQYNEMKRSFYKEAGLEIKTKE